METQQERWVLLCRSRVGSGAPAAALAPGLRWAGPCPPPGLWAPHFPGPGALPRARSFLFLGGAASRVSPASCGRSGLRGAVRTHVSCRASTSELFSIGLSLSLFFKSGILFFPCYFLSFSLFSPLNYLPCSHFSLPSPPTCAPNPVPRWFSTGLPTTVCMCICAVSVSARARGPESTSERAGEGYQVFVEDLHFQEKSNTVFLWTLRRGGRTH